MNPPFCGIGFISKIILSYLYFSVKVFFNFLEFSGHVVAKGCLDSLLEGAAFWIGLPAGRWSRRSIIGLGCGLLEEVICRSGLQTAISRDKLQMKEKGACTARPDEL